MYLAKDGVLAGELVAAVKGDEELAAVAVRAGARHGHKAAACEPQARVKLVLERLAEDALAACNEKRREVAQ